MKYLTLLALTCFLSFQLNAQTSPLDPVCTFNYQAVARGADDVVMANQAVTIRFTILDGPGANELYIEEHETTTSSLGLINLEVGAGTRTGGSLAFEAIPWIIRKHFLKVDMDMDASGNFINLGEAPILAVPIAISAKVAGTSVTTLDTIKRIDTLRVDTIKVIKLKADTICVSERLKIDDGELIMKDKDGMVIFSVDKDGNSYHKGFETFSGGLEVMDILGKVIFEVDPFFGNSFYDDVLIKGGELIMQDKDGNTIFGVDTLGNSFHKGFETFAGGLEVLGLDGKPVFIVDTLFGNTTVVSGDLALDVGNFDMYDRDGNIVFSVDTLGNSYHAGHEVFADGISLINFDQLEIFSIDPNANPLSDYAFNLQGNAMISGILQAEVKNFVIDHPLDPDNKTLRHYSIESDQMGTIYNGTTSFDKNGEAWVELPTWFEALNTDFSYQLTCIGGFANVYVAQEVKNNRFKIAGGNKDLKVSWQVNAVRHDPVSSKHVKPIEEYKKRIE